MATQAATNDEELLIITEDADAHGNVSEIAIEQDESSIGDELISFEEVKEETENMDSKTTNSDVESSSQTTTEALADLEDDSELSLDFDLWDDTSDLTVEEMFSDDSDSKKSPESIISDTTEDLIDLSSLDTDTKTDIELKEREESKTEDDIFDLNFWDSEEKLEDSESKNSDEETTVKVEDNILNIWLDTDASTNTKAESSDEGLLNISLDDEGAETSAVEIKESDSLENISLDVVSAETNGESTNNLDISLASWIVWTASATQWSWTQQDDQDGDDVNTILDATIAKLIKRKEQIETVKAQTIEQIDKLNEEIKWLQKDVKDQKAEVKDFDKETSKIEDNIAWLEKMKMTV